ncbi:MAG: adenylate/guanylate cyclase domain-containing protein, partial [Desulfobacterales bacterium CG23_combo_of_CG06-09_8_20_14_all_52_9]
MAVTALFLLLYPLKLRLPVALDHKLYDSLLTSAPLQKTTGLAVVVDIDEKSLKRFGQWPWPRYRMAQLAERLFRCGALAVSFDMVFAEPDRTSLLRLSEEMARDLDVEVRFQEVPEKSVTSGKAGGM